MAQTVNDFLQVPYVDGGRDWSGFDCWGCVRMARAELFGKSLMNAFGHVIPNRQQHHYQAMTDVFNQFKHQYQEVEPRPGAIAGCFKKGLLLHVGIVVNNNGRLAVLHTNASGPKLESLKSFNRLSLDVRYFDDCDHNHLPQQAG